MGRKDTGKNFENEIRRSLKGSKHIWWFRIQDTNDINRFVKVAVAEKQPADFFTVYRSRPIMLEAKTSRNLTSFPLHYGSSRAIPKHQVSYGEGLVRAGGIALILIRREEYRNKKCYAITPSQAKYLYSKGFRYRIHVSSLPGCPDVVIKKKSIAIQVRGCFWHGHRCHLASYPKTNRSFWKKKISDNRKRDKKKRY